MVQLLRLLTLNPVDGVQFPALTAVFFIVLLIKGFALCFMCSDYHVKHLVGFPSLALLMGYHVEGVLQQTIALYNFIYR